jgi:hypothetical protein
MSHDKSASLKSVERLQDNILKVNIQNEKMVTQIEQLKTKLNGKDRLVRHLETKVTQIMVEKEDSVVKMKSETMLLQNKLDESEMQITRKLNAMRQKLVTEAKE